MKEPIAWLLEGDVSIQYLVHRDLLHSDESTLAKLQERIPLEGYGVQFLSCQNKNGHWGLYYYQPKWTSTHYTLLDLKNLGVPHKLKPCTEMVKRMFDECMCEDGGLNLSKYDHPSDICVDGMILNYAAYFCKDEPRIKRLAAFLLSSQKEDGGFSWDCQSASGDPHTTVCVLEGLAQYSISAEHRTEDIDRTISKGVEFLLSRRLFFDDADKRFRKLSYPYRYRYDLLRALECFSSLKTPFDVRMQPALDWLKAKRKEDGLWFLENRHGGNIHFSMEEVGMPSRFITQKALFILNTYR